MRIAVIGATGRTGAQVVAQGLARGHEMRAVARRAAAVATSDPRLEVAEADVLDAPAVAAALNGVDAVVSALGTGTSRAPTTLYSEGVANVLAAMGPHGPDRLAVVSAAPVGPDAGQPAVARRVVLPVLRRLFGATYQDMARMEALLESSGVAWASLRPPRLVGRGPVGHYRIERSHPPRRGGTLTFADLATALLDVLERPDLHRHRLYVAN